MIEDGLVDYLLSKPSITNLVVSRIDPVKSPSDEIYPRITYQRIDTNRGKHLAGHDGLPRARIQVNCWGEIYSDAKGLANEIRKLFASGFAGTMGTFTVRAVWVDDDRDLPDQPGPADDNINGVSIDLQIWYVE